MPAELQAAIRAPGVERWTIWRSGPELFDVIECADYARMLRQLADLPVNVAWQARMADLLEVVRDYGSEGSAAGLPVVWELGVTAAAPDRHAAER